MTVVVICIESHSFQIKGDTKTIYNVVEIKKSLDYENCVEIVKGKNWSVLVNMKFNTIQII